MPTVETRGKSAFASSRADFLIGSERAELLRFADFARSFILAPDDPTCVKGSLALL